MDRKRYEAFTLIEMLIVMGILVILMAVGIVAGRFATQRAQDIAHQNAVGSIYQAAQSYYVDFGAYPEIEVGETLADLMGTAEAPGDLGKYLDLGAFDGGNDATFWYFVNGNTHQSVIVCVTLGGHGDTGRRGIYCDGNGFGDEELAVGSSGNGGSIPKGKMDYSTEAPYTTVLEAGGTESNWNGKTNTWGTIYQTD